MTEHHIDQPSADELHVYPITAELRMELSTKVEKLGNKKFAEMILEVVGEYEHGSADIEDFLGDETRERLTAIFGEEALHRFLLKLYADIALDLYLIMAYPEEKERG